MKPKIFGPLLFQIKELQIQIQICLGVNETSQKQPKSSKTSQNLHPNFHQDNMSGPPNTQNCPKGLMYYF